jgi:hypothetical protein
MGRRKIVKDERERVLCPVCHKEYVSRKFLMKYKKCVVCYYDMHCHPAEFGDEELPESKKYFEARKRNRLIRVIN